MDSNSKCKKCQNELTSDELFAHLADSGHEEGLCNNCNKERKESIGNTTPEGYDKGQKHNKSFGACYLCGKPLRWKKDDTGKSIQLDLTGRPHECPKNMHKGSTITKPIQHTKVEVKKPEEKLEEIQPVQISESILFDIEKIPKDDPIINEIIDGHNEKQLGIIHYDQLKAPDPEKIPVGRLSDVLDNKIIEGLKNCGIDGLLEFQEKAIRAILNGKSTIISAPTGSGKTEAFTVPIIQKILKNYSNGVFALLVYPLNALIDDQITKIKTLIQKCGLENKIEVFGIHGNQASGYKEKIIQISQNKCVILATNFDFINYHLIMQTPKWKMIKSAKVIVMDEAHSYNSFHGSNVYHVIKRMKKYMKDIQFIGSSATLDNAKEFFSEMFDLPIDSIQSINTTKGRKRNMHRFFIMPRKYGQRSTMERLSGMCFRNKRKQLVFSNKHKDAEYLARNVEEDNKNIRIEVHRGGLKQADKRLTEIAMKDGDLDIISCTPTLELGIDIGLVDVAISAFKSEYDAFVQRIGRAGRSGQKSYAICVLDPDDAMCHYYSREGKIENEYIKQKHYTRLNKDNPIISEKHAAATQAEYDAKANPFTKYNQYHEFALSINLRGTSGELDLKLSHDSSNMGRRDAPAGYYELYQNALYPYNKHPYQVDSITKTKNGAQVFLSPSNEKNKKTEPMVKTTLTEKIMEKQRESESELMSIPIRYGRITILRTIVGYYKGDYGREESEAFKGEDIPSWNNFSWSSTHMAIGVVLPSEFVNSVMITENSQRKDDPGIHTISHIFVNAAKIVTKAEAIEIDAYYEDGIIYLYDNTAEGANGCSQMIYENFEKVLEICRDLLTKCDCDKSKDADWGGCPKCTYTTGFCLTKNKELSKQTAKGFFGVL